MSDKFALSDALCFVGSNCGFRPPETRNARSRRRQSLGAARSHDNAGPLTPGDLVAEIAGVNDGAETFCYCSAKNVATNMLRPLPRLDQLAFADLVEKAHGAAFEAEFPANGALVKQMRRDRAYWYYRGYDRAADAVRGAQTVKYVGPADDPEIERRVAAFATLRADYRARRGLAARLRRAGLPAPLPFDGAVLAAIAAAGVFRLRAVLVGSAAYPTYSGLIGARLPEARHSIDELDVAQDYGISVALDDRSAPLETALQKVDPSFSPFEKCSAPGLAVGFLNARGFKVEFLFTHRGDRAHDDDASQLLALAIDAQPLAFLDYLLRDPVPSVALHEAGIAVFVPAPARYAIHKLVVAARRTHLAKARKDIEQAAALIEASFASGRRAEIEDAVADAAARGSSWSTAIRAGLARLPERVSPLVREISQGIADVE